MKPVPPEILALYPSHPDAAWPGRPWWRRPRDCSEATCDRHPMVTARTESQAATIDAARPIPHPGLRVGQVWASMYVSPMPRADLTIQVIIITKASVELGCAAEHLQHIITPNGMQFFEPNNGYVFRPAWLLADPCCPWLAPWGPA